MRKAILIATVFAAAIAAVQPVLAQASDQQIRFDPRVITMPRTPPPQADPASDLQVSREAGAGNISVDSSTFDMFAQMVRRFNALEQRIDQLSQQNAALADELAKARRTLDSTSENLLRHIATSERLPSGQAIGTAVAHVCSMVSELLVREKNPSVLGIELGSTKPEPC